MNWFDAVLGGTWILMLPSAIMLGAFSGHVKASSFFPVKDPKPLSEWRKDLFLKLFVISIFAGLVYFDSDDLEDVFFRVVVPVGLYKIVQVVTTSFFVWRKLDSGGARFEAEVNHD
ncbi:MAG: hypothetical protein H2056_05425 [Sphingopyxis sp.]|nr:hypothetical protein [Sphingopyxis sp.]